jgi:hypothetical protein
MTFFQNLREAIDADFSNMRNRFNDPKGGGWTDTKEGMRGLAEVFHALGAHARAFANETHDKGGYTGAYAELVHQLGAHSTKVGDECVEALNVIMRAHGELVEYAENAVDGRFDKSRNEH